MTRKLATHVAVDGTWYGPDSDVPADVAKRITNPKVWADGSGSEAVSTQTGGDDPAAKEPPRGGPGSGVDAWRAHAKYLGVSHPDDAGAKDIAVLVDEHNAKKG